MDTAIAATLNWQVTDAGARFAVIDASGRPTRFEDWGRVRLRVGPQGTAAGSVGALLGLVEDGVLEVFADTELMVPHPIVAGFDERVLAQLGLPAAAPLRLRVRGRGILTSPSFRFDYQLVMEDGTAPMGLKRNGFLVEWSGRRYALLDPLFTLTEGMDAFNALPPQEMDERMLRWAELKPLLPDNALVDGNLRSINIVRADAFTLDVNDAGEFSPQLLHQPVQVKDDDDSSERPPGRPALPESAQRDFGKRFRSQSDARRRYTVAGNWFVVVPPRLYKVLGVVRQMQEATYAQRRAFIANPDAVLKEHLGEEFDEAEIDGFFQETPEFLSARISHLGEWEPKKNAYVLPSGQKWFPDEGTVFGLVLGGRVVEIAESDIEQVLEQVGVARAQGAPHVDYHGQHVPATEEAEESLERIGRTTRGASASTSDPSADSKEAASEGKPGGKAEVPILHDNIEDLGFTAKARPIRGAPGGLPGVLKTVELYPHQREGLRWLQEHWASGSSGALLADDMGLGKTLQTLAFLAWVQEQMEAGKHPRKPILIVAPTGLLKNWEDEAGIHLAGPGLGELFRAYGASLSTLKGLSHNQRKAKFDVTDWVLTTYETLRDKIRYFLPIDWAVIAFDETQKIKNPASRLTEMAKSVQADFVIALTGTPVENRLGDLWSIIDAVAAGELGSMREFHKKYEVQDPENNQRAIGELRTLLTESPKPVRLLRRMKADHLKGLPEKHEHLIRQDMPAAQAENYTALVASARQASSPEAMLALLHAMRKVSLLSEPIEAAGIDDQVVDASARLKTAVRLLDQIREKREKALVFIEFLDVQDALLPYLQKRYGLPWLPLKISGKVSGATRKKHVDEFQRRPREHFDVMLLSPKAGGVGLTLTAANHVIHLSRWWNPAVEDQCTDRVFRIGQDKPVNVYVPLAVHPRYRDSSFDLNLHALLTRKRELSRELLAPSVASQSDLAELFNQTLGKE